jgi:hypothetical protein
MLLQSSTNVTINKLLACHRVRNIRTEHELVEKSRFVDRARLRWLAELIGVRPVPAVRLINLTGAEWMDDVNLVHPNFRLARSIIAPETRALR